MSLDKSVHLSAGALVFSGNKVLAIKRLKEPFKGNWSVVGGHVEEKELPNEAAVREVKEETGLDIELIDPYIEIPVEFSEGLKRLPQPILVSLLPVKDHYHISFTYAAKAKSTEIKINNIEGLVQWIDTNNKEISPHLRLAIDTYKRVLGA
ncbi:MAG: NUDIX domain-containing protein [Candidatus Aenigmarchaeota archaeon]|nr:NUDIX domain-containing protein [Candidatus Aenigmarchaeota archaeon]